MEGLMLPLIAIGIACWYDTSRRCATLERRMLQVEHLAELLDGRVFRLHQVVEAPAGPPVPSPGPLPAPPMVPRPAATAVPHAAPRMAAGSVAASPGPAWHPPVSFAPPVLPGPPAAALPPAPPAASPYTEKARRGEMEFAGTYLNVAGVLFLLVGAVMLLRTATHGAGSGALQTLAGLVAGVALLVAGERSHRQGMRAYAPPLVACGLGLLLLTHCAAHFYFHFIDRTALFVSVVAIVTGGGLAVFRYDSRLIGNLMLGALYLGPVLLEFGQGQPGLVFAYLVAIHVGTALVAWHKKWDYFLLASFLGSYALFFALVGTRPPALGLAFTTMVYLLFLVSNNVVHFKRRAGDPYDLALSFVNPLVYAVVSYSLLLAVPNAVAVALYSLLAAIHLILARAARAQGREDLVLAGVAMSNFVLGLAFLTAAISFITYFSTETTYFAVVTALWFVEAFGLLALSLRTAAGDPFAVVLRRFSAFSLFLATAQLLVVIPTLDGSTPAGLLHALVIRLLSVGAYLAYAAWMHRLQARLSGEDLRVGQACALLGGLQGLLLINDCPSWHFQIVAFSALTLLAAHLSLDRRTSCTPLSWLAAALVPYTTVRTLLLPGLTLSVGTACVLQVALCLVLGLRLRKAGVLLLPWERQAVIVLDALAATLLFRAALCVSAGVPGTLLWMLLSLALLHATTSRPREQGLEALVRLGFFLAFLKSILFDGNFVATPQGLEIAQPFSMTAGQMLATMAVVAGFFGAARHTWDHPEPRNHFLTLGLVVFAFQSAAVLYNFYGVLDTFQIILSAFWGTSAFFSIAFGIHRESRICRLFGLVLLVSTVLKICFVDIWVLNAYSQTTTFLIMGGMLMAVSFLYHAHRDRLVAPTLAPELTPVPIA